MALVLGATNAMKDLLLTLVLLIGAVSLAIAGEPPAGQRPAETSFDVHEYRVLGNTVLPNIDIERVLYPLLGDHKTLADVEVARTALEKLYRDRGYATIFVDIPEQDVGDAVVRLRVTEGKLRQVTIGGAKYFSERKILAAVPEATPGTVPQVPALQQQLAAVNSQSADLSVVPILKAGPTPGTVDLALKVDDHSPLHGSLDLNNQYSPDTKPLRATVALSYNNLFNNLDSISAQYQESPQRPGQIGVLAVNYAFGPWESGARPSMYYVHSNSDVATLGTIGVLGKGDIFGTRLSFPIASGPGTLQSIVIGADYKHFRDTIGLASQPAVVTPISYLNLSLAYAGNWSDTQHQNIFSASANFGPRYAPNNADTFANKRYAGQANYFYLRADETYVFILPKEFHLLLRAAGQFAVEPLISNENYAIAGIDGVRGYLEAETLGDRAIKGTVQFESPAVVIGMARVFNGFVYYDEGHDYVIDPLSSVPGSATLRSVGAGLNLLPWRAFTGNLTWSDPLTNGPRTRRGDARLQFDIRAAF